MVFLEGQTVKNSLPERFIAWLMRGKPRHLWRAVVICDVFGDVRVRGGLRRWKWLAHLDAYDLCAKFDAWDYRIERVPRDKKSP